jgi:replication factor C large subunit
MTELWTEKYSPKNPEEFVGNAETVKELELWAMEWNKHKTGKPLLLFGPVGSGKTALAHLIARLNQWDLFELNASDFRAKDVIERLVGAALQNASFSGELRLVLLDEVDGVQGKEDKGGMAAILQVLKEARNPVILTANDIYSNRSMATIRNYCRKIEFKKINYLSVAKRLKAVCEAEGIEYDLVAINELAKESSGDLRAALLDLQSLSMKNQKVLLEDVQSLGFREREEKIFSVLGKIFHAKTLSECREARQSCEVSDDLLFQWIDENIPLQFKQPGEAAVAFERLSRADVFNGRILNRQHWGFLRYSSDLATAGVSFARSPSEAHEFVMYRFPSLLSRLSASSSDRAMRKQIAEKIQKKMHASKREIVSYDLPFLMALFEKHGHAVGFSAAFNFDADEIAFLMESEPSAKKVQSVFEESKELAQKAFARKRKPLSALHENELREIEQKKEEKQSRLSLRDNKGQSRLF